MPTRIIKALFIALCLLFAPKAMAEPYEPAGGSIEAVDDNGKKLEFPVLKTDIRAKVRGDLVTVTLEQVFSNPHSQPLHARYLFPLNHDAAVNEMVMEVGDERIEAQIKRKEEAKATFEKAKKEGKAASLLTQERPNMFTQNIANLMPGMPVRVILTYVQTLPKIDGEYELVLPLVVGPRYQPANAGRPPMPGGEVTSKGKFGKWELEQMPAYPPVAGLNIPDTIDNDRVSVDIDVDGGVPVAYVKSDTHKIVVDKVSDRKRAIRLAEDRTIDNRDFVLRYSLSGALTQAGLLAAKDKRGGFFSLQLEPPKVPVAADIAAREIVFILDTSGSMSGAPMEASKVFMRHALQGLRRSDFFRVIRFSSSAEELHSGPVPATAENIKNGVAYVESLYANGGTEAMSGLEQAFAVAQQPDTLRLVVLLTDGYIGNESSVLRLTAEKIGRARVYAFGVGTSVNRYLLDEMARMGRGFARYVDPTEESKDAAISLATKLESPVLTDISVDWGKMGAAEVVPQRIPDLFAGGAIRLQGRYTKPGKHEIRINGLVNGRKASLPMTIDLPRENVADGSPIPVVWARAQVSENMRLLDTPHHLRDHEYDDDKLKEKVVNLGLDFSLMTRWTSFVAVSKKIVNVKPELAKQTDVPLPMVKGVTQLAFGQGHNQMAFSGGSVPEPSEVAGMAALALLLLAWGYMKFRDEIRLKWAIWVLGLRILFVRCRLRYGR